MNMQVKGKLQAMREGGKKLKSVREALLAQVSPGVTGRQLDALATKRIKELGGVPSFTMVPGYRWATCICTNDIIVHGIPSDTPFKKGDIVGVDVGMYYQGYHTDTSWSIVVEEKRGKKPFNDLNHFLAVGEHALSLGIGEATVGKRVGHISEAIGKEIEGAGFGVVRSLVGHGIGKKLHEKPEIPGVLRQKIEATAPLLLDMTLAIEVIYARGKPDIKYDQDGWTIRTKDGSVSGLFEMTIAITEGEPSILT